MNTPDVQRAADLISNVHVPIRLFTRAVDHNVQTCHVFVLVQLPDVQVMHTQHSLDAQHRVTHATE